MYHRLYIIYIYIYIFEFIEREGVCKCINAKVQLCKESETECQDLFTVPGNSSDDTKLRIQKLIPMKFPKCDASHFTLSQARAPLYLKAGGGRA